MALKDLETESKLFLAVSTERICSPACLQALLEIAEEKIIICNRKGDILLANLSPAKPNIFLWFTSKKEEDKFNQLLEQNKKIKQFEATLNYDSKPKKVYLNAILIPETDELIVTFSESEILSQLCEQLSHSEKMAAIGQMAAGIAHELNTPLGIILGYTQLLEEDLEGQDEVYEMLKKIETQAKLCKRIVKGLLKFAREEKKHLSEVNINELIEEVLSLIEHTLAMDFIEVVRRFDQNIPLYRGDPEKLKQVFMNLITNAQHAIGEKGKIYITTKYLPDKKEIMVAIADTGCGIPPEIKDRIFEPFFTTKEEGKGTGLGLAVVKAILEEHGASIEFQSPVEDENLGEKGKGTVFIIHFPLKEKIKIKEGKDG